VDICGLKWPEPGPETQIGGGLESSSSILLQCFSRVERVTGIEPALSAWEWKLCPRESTADWVRAAPI